MICSIGIIVISARVAGKLIGTVTVIVPAWISWICRIALSCCPTVANVSNYPHNIRRSGCGSCKIARSMSCTEFIICSPHEIVFHLTRSRGENASPQIRKGNKFIPFSYSWLSRNFGAIYEKRIRLSAGLLRFSSRTAARATAADCRRMFWGYSRALLILSFFSAIPLHPSPKTARY